MVRVRVTSGSLLSSLLVGSNYTSKVKVNFPLMYLSVYVTTMEIVLGLGDPHPCFFALEGISLELCPIFPQSYHFTPILSFLVDPSSLNLSKVTSSPPAYHLCI